MYSGENLGDLYAGKSFEYWKIGECFTMMCIGYRKSNFIIVAPRAVMSVKTVLHDKGSLTNMFLPTFVVFD